VGGMLDCFKQGEYQQWVRLKPATKALKIEILEQGFKPPCCCNQKPLTLLVLMKNALTGFKIGPQKVIQVAQKSDICEFIGENATETI
jgi:hypothetical protein